MAATTALVLCGLLTGCSHDFDSVTTEQTVLENYEKVFYTAFGTPAATQDWGFGSTASEPATASTRSQAEPSVPGISAPFDEDWVADYLTTAKEPDSSNVGDNYDNTTYAINYGSGGPNDIDWNNAEQVAEHDYFFSLSWEAQIAYAKAYHPTWLTYNEDATFVRHFKITGTWNGDIGVVATEGYTDGVANGNERTVVVTGTWNITADQRVGSRGKIIIANGGTVTIADGKKLSLVNEARLVVLSGGTLTGGGSVEVSNGNAAGEENYNAGTISVATFNNNFGKFYNYGKFLVTEYQGGAQESNFYNHSLVSIDHCAGTPNARIFNACQWYCRHDMRVRNIEETGGAAFIVGGELMLSGSADGTTDDSYVSLAAGALVTCGTLYNNGTSWSGPTSGHAVVSTGQITYLNWAQDTKPLDYGYFENNIYVEIKDATNIPSGNGSQSGETATAAYKFWHIVANGLGDGTTARDNGGVAAITASSNDSDEVIPADNDFVAGTSGCTPGYKGTTGTTPTPPDEEEEESPTAVLVIAEDLTTGSENGDFDFNDAVFKVELLSTGKVKITPLAAGGTLPLYIESREIHELFGQSTGTMINTNSKVGNHVDNRVARSFTIDNPLPGETDARKIAKEIKVEVMKMNPETGALGLIELHAPVGQAAAKVCVGTDFEWCSERQSIDDKYQYSDNLGPAKGRFTLYVQGKFSGSDANNWYKSNVIPVLQ